MIERLFPDEEVNKVEDITVDYLSKRNIKALILDIDNTLSDWNSDPESSVINWLETMKRNDIKLCLVSNNKKTRVEKVGAMLSIHAIHSALKPRRRAFISALTLMGVKAAETAVMGDQIFTDVYGGNRLNMYTIYVRPISERETAFIKMKRPFEKFILAKFRIKELGHSERRMVWKERSGKIKLRRIEGRLLK